MNGFLFEEGRDTDVGISLWFGKFATDVLEFSDKAYILLPDFDATKRFGPCFWQSRDDITLPQEGDRCSVMFDNRQQPWVIAWWPFNN